MKRPRDSQKQKFLDAEDRIKTYYPIPSGRITTKITHSRWWRAFDTDNPLKHDDYETHHRNARSCVPIIQQQPLPSVGVIWVSDSTYPLVEILHSLAHCLQPNGSAFHGPEFVSIFLRMIERFIAPDARKVSKKILMNHGVKTKAVSVESREKMRARYVERVSQGIPDKLVNILKELEEQGATVEPAGSMPRNG